MISLSSRFPQRMSWWCPAGPKQTARQSRAGIGNAGADSISFKFVHLTAVPGWCSTGCCCPVLCALVCMPSRRFFFGVISNGNIAAPQGFRQRYEFCFESRYLRIEISKVAAPRLWTLTFHHFQRFILPWRRHRWQESATLLVATAVNQKDF